MGEEKKTAQQNFKGEEDDDIPTMVLTGITLVGGPFKKIMSTVSQSLSSCVVQQYVR